MMNVQKQNNGLTLVELLVSITVLTIVTALIVPRIRVINKERTIREAARVAGSVFSTARDRAIAEGCAGVIIERNLNLSSTTGDGNLVFFAGTRLFQLRNIPDYIGDTLDAEVEFERGVDSDGNDVFIGRIPRPLELDDGVIFPGDTLQVGVARYPIREIIDNGGKDVLLVLAWDDDANVSNGLDVLRTDFVTNTRAPEVGEAEVLSIKRQPRKIESSVVDLPAGYIIDLRYSGPLDLADNDEDAETATQFGLGTNPNLTREQLEAMPELTEIRVVFNEKGSLDQVLLNGRAELVGTSLNLFVNEFEPSLQLGAEATAATLLSNPDSLWVTIGFNGGVNIGYNAPVAPADLATMIDGARNLSSNRTSALQ